MASRLDRHDYDTEPSNSRVAKNQELYRKLYDEDSYIQAENNPPLERTTEIDIEKVRELLRGREIYRKEMKMREYNILKPEAETTTEEVEPEEKKYDINEYLNKASNEKEYQPYHKLDIEHVAAVEEIEKEYDEAEDEPSLDALEKMGNTELSLDMFGDLSGDSEDNEELDDEEFENDEIEDDENSDELEDEEVESEEETDDERDVDDTFFTGSIKIHLADNDDDEEEESEGSSLFVKIIMVILIIIIIVLVAFLLFL